MTVRIGVDTGGTFTDVVLYDEETGEIHTTKTPSTPPNFDEGVHNGVDKILSDVDVDSGRTSFISHGTTVGTNAILEGNIPDLGLITNEGLRDVLEIGDQTRPDLYDFNTEKPPSLIPRSLRREVPGRIDFRGSEIDPLDEEQTKQVIDELVEADVEAIVVSMLFSYLNETHEERIGELIEDHPSAINYSLASSIYPEIREYDRTISTVLNEAITTTIEEYFARLDEGLLDRGITVPLNVMHSGGGVFGTDQLSKYAIRTVLSGPAAGVVAMEKMCQNAGIENAIGMDMGGTSTDVSIVRDGDIVRSTEGEINNLPIKTPMIDISTIGSGGGSIVWIDEGGALRVGPESAGADPGPICYGLGGEAPTLTDANLLLGRINPDASLAEGMDLDIERTRELFEEKIADPIGKSVAEAAASVVKIANASIVRQIKKVTVERGQDPDDFSLVPFGGAGPLQAYEVAEAMEMGAIIIPKNPGVFSARGLLVADIKMDEARAYREQQIDRAVLRDQFTALEDELYSRFGEQGYEPTDVTIERAADMRYRGQAYELTVPVGEVDTDSSVDTALESFHRIHEQRYGHARTDETVEIVTVRVTGTVETPVVDETVKTTDEESYRQDREVYFEKTGFVTTEIHDRDALSPGDNIDGPAIIEGSDSSFILPPDATVETTESKNLLISL